jgi:hypothetical protein
MKQKGALTMQQRRLKPIGKPGYENRMEIRPAIVESPYAKGEYGPAVRNIRESNLAYMHSHGQIDDAQRMAGEWFRATYERTRMGSMAVDPSHEPVDTSGRADPIPDRAIAAIEELTVVRGQLGRTSYAIVELVCGQGWSITDVASMVGRDKRKIGYIFQSGLDDLAELRGYATRPSR